MSYINKTKEAKYYYKNKETTILHRENGPAVEDERKIS